MATDQGKLVLVGALRGPHGLRGLVKAKLTLDDPELVVDGGPLLAADGRSWVVTKVQQAGQGLFALEIAGVSTVEAAEALVGVQVYLDRAAWPDTEGEVYVEDLVGWAVRGPEGEDLGVVAKVTELPAGPALEIGGKLLPVEEEFMALEDGVVVVSALGLAVLAV